MEQTPDTYIDLLFGYSVLWGLIVVFLFRLAREQARLRGDFAELRSELGLRQEAAGGQADLRATQSR